MPISDINLVNEGEDIFVKNLGEKIQNNNNNYKEILLIHGFIIQAQDFKLSGQGLERLY